MGWGVASQITCDMVCTCLVEVSFYYSLEGMAGLWVCVWVGGGGQFHGVGSAGGELSPVIRMVLHLQGHTCNSLLIRVVQHASNSLAMRMVLHLKGHASKSFVVRVVLHTSNSIVIRMVLHLQGHTSNSLVTRMVLHLQGHASRSLVIRGCCTCRGVLPSPL